MLFTFQQAGLGRTGRSSSYPGGGGEGGGGSDPDFANVVLLLHMNGTDEATSFPDTSTSAKTVTASGGAVTDTAESKFGGASGRFDGGRLTVPMDTSLQFGTGDFTIEFFTRTNTGGARIYFVLGAYNTATIGFACYSSSGVLNLFHTTVGRFQHRAR